MTTMQDKAANYYAYWGKTSEDGGYHLLPYQCLDVISDGWMCFVAGISGNGMIKRYELERR